MSRILRNGLFSGCQHMANLAGHDSDRMRSASSDGKRRTFRSIDSQSILNFEDTEIWKIWDRAGGGHPLDKHTD